MIKEKEWEKYIEETTHEHYHVSGVPCAVSTLTMLSHIFGVELHEQVYQSALGMVGAGKYGAQCGLLEGGMMFLAIYGQQNGLVKKDIFELTYKMTETFENSMGSIVCKGLRPYPFTPEDAPKHLCEPVTVKGVTLLVKFLQDVVEPAFPKK